MTYLIDPKNGSTPFYLTDENEFDLINWYHTNYPECIVDSAEDGLDLHYTYGDWINSFTEKLN